MTCEHLRPLLDERRAMQLLFKLGENLARAHVPQVVESMVRSGRMTAFSKLDGGVRGIVSGDVIRRLVARTMAQQLGPAVKSATAPHQYALSTRAGCECIAHALQGLCDLNPSATVTLIDGVGAFDSISRRAMLTGLAQVSGGASTLPFVRMFYGSPSQYLWDDDDGVSHTIPQGEGGEQGDAMMPLLFALGQHEALQAANQNMREGEFLFAFHDDVVMVTNPDRVGPVYAAVQDSLLHHAGIRVHVGKTKVWNKSGVRPQICDVLERIARDNDPTARVWKGSGVPLDQQGVKILGTPLGHQEYVSSFLNKISEKHQILFQRIPLLSDVQSAWLLLAHCAGARATYTLRCVDPVAVEEFARRHDQDMFTCLSQILQVDPASIDVETRDSATLPMSLGGLGIRSAVRTCKAAHAGPIVSP